MRRQPIPFWKASATAGGAALTGTAVWLNAEHVAVSEGWYSPLVLAGIFVTLCPAATPPLAERAVKTGQPAKAVVLWMFFALAVSFSLTASIARSGGYRDTQVAEAEQSTLRRAWQKTLTRSRLQTGEPNARADVVQDAGRRRRTSAKRGLRCA
jgi:hypothetical protein